ncbi:Uncharacterized conserved protein, DUF924 family [Modicisalibacter ilicicola DSM 19980]|uniref:Uncharacterized conserved protein, DUF924 family n=1 Tax=Modicisalibacter ilicicola DSM 19980 TaxID=1121942 RepID=A0A1M4Y7G5_9GAMM|nr:DUF924 family protein [Halomonas ilicicola]SHF01658.1 Uncharacterized conserved protein, DUF924 family [Halomonas ilicicola DSM 19980]
MTDTTAQTVLHFWFDEATPRQWFAKDQAFDSQVAERFSALLDTAIAGELWMWRRSPQGRLAEILVLDQFSRNIHRDRAASFAQDPQALALAQEAVAARADRHLKVGQRAFLYMPYMHSESLRIHDEALRLFDQPGLEDNLHHERRHRAILERFGRYPHRNATLGRDSTAEEKAFLGQPGSSF